MIDLDADELCDIRQALALPLNFNFLGKCRVTLVKRPAPAPQTGAPEARRAVQRRGCQRHGRQGCDASLCEGGASSFGSAGWLSLAASTRPGQDQDGRGHPRPGAASRGLAPGAALSGASASFFPSEWLLFPSGGGRRCPGLARRGAE